MAVPKKRTPKSRRNSRRSVWFKKAFQKRDHALLLALNWTKVLEEESRSN